MKKLSVAFLMLMVLSLGTFISCDKEEDEIENLVGTWELSEVVEGFSMTITVTFNSDQTGSSSTVYMEDGETESETGNFTYSIDGSTITIVTDEESSIITYSISGNKLTITDDGDLMVFTKK